MTSGSTFFSSLEGIGSNIHVVGLDDLTSLYSSSSLLQPCGCSVYSAVLGLSVSALPRESHPIGSCRLIVPVS